MNNANLNVTDDQKWLAAASPSAARLKFWEINHFLTCPVVGLCLSLKEQKQILKKVGISLKQKDEFQIHEILVACASDENRISKKADALLARKFDHRSESLCRQAPADFKSAWKTAFMDGETDIALWVAATRRDLSAEFRREVFADIHMSMHGNAERESRLRMQIASQQARLEKMDRLVKATAIEKRAMRAERADFRREKMVLEKTLEASEKRALSLDAKICALSGKNARIDLERENAFWGERVRQLTESLARRDRQLEEAEGRNRKAGKELARWQRALPALQAEVLSFFRKVGALNHCDSSCPAFDLCQKRVLVVGGMERIAAFYRELVEDVGGVFEYHNGYMKGGAEALENRLRRADMVLCPVSCNSHAACTLVKKLGKKHKKPVHMLASASRNAVSHALREEDACSINGHLAN